MTTVRRRQERLRSLLSLTAGGSAAFLGLGLWSNNQTFYSGMVMPLVHRLEPETAHRAAVWAAAHGLVPHDRSADHPVLVRAPLRRRGGLVELADAWEVYLNTMIFSPILFNHTVFFSRVSVFCPPP